MTFLGSGSGFPQAVNLFFSPPFFNAAAYGVTANGVTNDTASWVLVMAAAAAAGGGIVVAPAGISIVNAGVIKVPNKTIIDAPGLTFQYSGTGGGPTSPIIGFANSQPAQVGLKNFTIDVNGFATALIYGTTTGAIQTLPGILVEDVLMTSSVAGSLINTSSHVITIPAANSFITRCTLTNLAQVKVLFGQPDCIFSYNKMYSNTSTYFMTFSWHETANNCQFSFNLCDSIGAVNVQYAGFGAVIANNQLYNLSGSGTLPLLSTPIFLGGNQAVMADNTIAQSTIIASQNIAYNFNGAGGALSGNVLRGCTFNNAITFTGYDLNNSDAWACGNNTFYQNQMATSSLQMIPVKVVNTGWITSPISGFTIAMNAAVVGGTNVGIDATQFGQGELVITGNVFSNCNTAINVTASSSPSSGLVITGNTAYGNTGALINITATGGSPIQGVTITGNEMFSGGTDAVYLAQIENCNDFTFTGNTFSAVGGASTLGCMNVTGCGGANVISGNNFDTAAGVPATAVVNDATSPLLVTGNSGAGTITSIATAAANVQKANNYAWNGAAWAAA